MNIAFSGIILFLVFSAGIVFKRGYYSGKFSRKYIKIDLIDEITWAIIPGLIINIGCIYLFQWITGSPVNISSLGFLLTGFNNSSESFSIFKKIEMSLIPIAFFFILSWLLSFLLGKACLQGVRFFKLDHKYTSLRFSNHWYYFFSGEYLELKQYYSLKDDVEFLFFEVWIDMGGKIEKFKGFVDDFILSKDGGLETIYLLETLEDINNEIEENLNVEAIKTTASDKGDYLMIPAKLIVKINMWPALKKDHIIEDKELTP